MLFVTVGTTDFDPLIRQMDELASALGEEVVFQIANGGHEPRHGRWYRYAPSIEADLAAARLVVSHGGLGTIIETLRLGKPLVGVSNPDRPDLHQDELLGTMEAGGYLLWCRSLGDLPAAIERAATLSFSRYVEPPCTIHTEIAAFLGRTSMAGARRRIWRRAGL